jgi:flagellar biogenesis protein FliO
MLADLFGTFSGLLSLGVILFVIAMAIYLLWLFTKLSSQPSDDENR